MRRAGSLALPLLWVAWFLGSSACASDPSAEPAGSSSRRSRPSDDADASSYSDSGTQSDASTGASGGGADATTNPGPLAFDLLQANVGNASIDCQGYKFKLCSVEVERRIAANVRARAAQVLSLQELVPDAMCDEKGETNSARVCHPGHRASEPNQARRLVGPGYSIACDARSGFDCVAVATEFGTIRGCQSGALCNGVGTTLPAGMGCDDGFSVSSYVIEPVAAEPFVVVVGHPPSGNAVACRAGQIRGLFDTLLAAGMPALVAGDFNLDPYRQQDDSVTAFTDHVGPGRPYQLLSGLAEHDPPYATSFGVLGNSSYDHVLSNALTGTCATLGEAPVTTRLDGGSGCDHRALACSVRGPQ